MTLDCEGKNKLQKQNKINKPKNPQNKMDKIQSKCSTEAKTEDFPIIVEALASKPSVIHWVFSSSDAGSAWKLQ